MDTTLPTASSETAGATPDAGVTQPAASEPVEQVAQTTEAVNEPVEQVAQTTEAVNEPVEQVAQTTEAVSEPVEQAAQAPAEPLSEPVDQPVEDVANTSPAVNDSVEAVADTTEAASEPIQAVSNTSDAVSEPVQAAASAPTDAASEPVQAASDTAQAATQPVTETLANTTEALSGPVPAVDEASTDAVTEPVQAAAQATSDASTTVLGAAETQTMSAPADAVEATTQSVTEPLIGEITDAVNQVQAAATMSDAVAAQIQTAGTNAAGSGAAVEAVAGTVEAVGGQVETLAGGAATSVGAVDAVAEPATAMESPSNDFAPFTVPPVAESPPPVESVVAVVEVPADPVAATGAAVDVVALDTGPEAAALGSPEFALPLTSWFDDWSGGLVSSIDMTAVNVAAVTALGVAGIYGVGRGVFSPGVSVLFTNVRLLPCVATAAIQHSTGAAASAVCNLAGGGGTHSTHAPFRPPLPSLPAGSFGDGYKDGANGLVRNLDLYERSDWLLAKLGVALGAVYLAIFTIWVALTRSRWNGGPRLRG